MGCNFLLYGNKNVLSFFRECNFLCFLLLFIFYYFFVTVWSLWNFPLTIESKSGFGFTRKLLLLISSRTCSTFFQIYFVAVFKEKETTNQRKFNPKLQEHWNPRKIFQIVRKAAQKNSTDNSDNVSYKPQPADEDVGKWTALFPSKLTET